METSKNLIHYSVMMLTFVSGLTGLMNLYQNYCDMLFVFDIFCIILYFCKKLPKFFNI